MERQKGGVERQVAVLVGAGVLLVVALYMISVVSSGTPAGEAVLPPDAETVTPSGPLPADVAREAEALEAEMAALTGEALLDKRRELLNLYARAQRFDRAAQVAEDIAEAENTERAWRLAGDLNFEWMRLQSGPVQPVYARRAVAAYERAKALNPGNLDIRTSLANAYIYDPDTPMKGVQEIRGVLAEDSTHVLANHTLGFMLIRINRLEQAEAQFEKVKRLLNDPSDPVYQEADRFLQSIRQQRRGDGS